MQFVKFEGKIPEIKRIHRKNLKGYFDEFMSTNIKVAKVMLNEGEYKDVVVARNVLNRSVVNHGYPITVRRVGKEIFLIRRDI